MSCRGTRTRSHRGIRSTHAHCKTVTGAGVDGVLCAHCVRPVQKRHQQWLGGQGSESVHGRGEHVLFRRPLRRKLPMRCSEPGAKVRQRCDGIGARGKAQRPFTNVAIAVPSVAEQYLTKFSSPQHVSCRLLVWLSGGRMAMP